MAEKSGNAGISPETAPDRPEGKAAFYVIAGQKFAVPPLPAGLYVVATPIGNLGDITIRALETLAGAEAILAEDTRTTRILLQRYGITTRLLAHHAHNEAEGAERALALLTEGRALALVSDAGTPLISDPGAALVRRAREAGHAVTGLPGPSALIDALAISGLAAEPFFFEGFLPAKAAARRRRLAALRGFEATLVFYEAPHRLAAMLADAAELLGDRPAAVARELTKRFEEVRRGTLAELAEAYSRDAQARGEIVVLVEYRPQDADAAEHSRTLDARLAEALARMTLKQAVAEVAAATGEARRLVYARALALKGHS
jgi:16S rRNA (cytidine1402-2'-O)-methyltransferase